MREAIEGVIRLHGEAQRLRDLNIRRAHVVGRISLWLESYNQTQEEPELRRKLEELRNQISELEKEIDSEDEERRIESALRRLSDDMTRWANRLELEHSPNPVRLDLKKLTVVVDEMDDYITLEQMGSGKNWLGYSLATHLALHKHFVRHNRPVPHFLVLDQPTQVFYPEEKDEEFLGSIDYLGLEDRTDVQRIFDLVFDVVKELAPGFQVIILDHADINDERFQKAVIERWRGGKALIPQSWYEDSDEV